MKSKGQNGNALLLLRRAADYGPGREAKVSRGACGGGAPWYHCIVGRKTTNWMKVPLGQRSASRGKLQF
jgi:hypothetical protein